jgi:hypothetical protein
LAGIRIRQPRLADEGADPERKVISKLYYGG